MNSSMAWRVTHVTVPARTQTQHDFRLITVLTEIQWTGEENLTVTLAASNVLARSARATASERE